MSKSNLKKIHSCYAAISMFMIFIISGCSFSPNYIAPDMELPENWEQEAEKSAVIRKAPAKTKPVAKVSHEDTGLTKGKNLTNWWKLLGDPVLDKLIDRAGNTNLDVKEAYYRIEESRARKHYSQGDFFPSIDAAGSYSRDRQSENGVLKKTHTKAEDSDNYIAGFDSSWEIDVFGRIRHSVRSAQASLEASGEYYNDIMVSLYAEVASAYVDLRTLQARIKYADQNIVLQKETLQLTQARFKSELVPKLDIEQANLNLATTEAAVSLLKKAQTETLNRLAILLGVFPKDLVAELSKPMPIPDVSSRIPDLLPVDIIRQRPDIRLAERNLAAQMEQIGVAKSQLYPKFQLVGSFYFNTLKITDFNDMSSRQYSFGSRADWNIFEGGKTINNIRIEKAKAQRLWANYRKTIINGVSDVENSMAFYADEKERFGALQRAADSSEKSVELAKTLYKSELTDFQNVLDMQRTLFNVQDNLAESKGQIIQEWIRIYKAFGGGWSQEMTENAKKGK